MCGDGTPLRQNVHFYMLGSHKLASISQLVTHFWVVSGDQWTRDQKVRDSDGSPPPSRKSAKAVKLGGKTGERGNK